jgi:hypothetical protein
MDLNLRRHMPEIAGLDREFGFRESRSDGRPSVSVDQKVLSL